MWSGPAVMLRVLFFWLFLGLTCGYAIWRGRKYEQMSAIICILATVISVIGHVLTRRYQPLDYSVVQLSDLAVDNSMLVAFVVIALRSDRFWPLWVAGLQLTISISHVLK